MAERIDVPAYLARLGLSDPGAPSVAGLFALHRAQVARIPYENVEIQLGRPTTVDPYQAVERIVRARRGGYCFHVNGAFATLLKALGYDVRWHVGGVQGSADPEPVGATGNHLALTVHGLPAGDCPDGVWLVDAGLGDGPYEPLPLRPGEYRQGPFTYRLSRSEVVADGWRYDHDPFGSLVGFDFGMAPAGPADFARMHERLSSSPESGFVRVFTAFRRDANGYDQLRGCVLSRVEGGGNRWDTELTTADRWYGTLAEVFGLTLDDVDPAEREKLWRRVQAGHEAWQADQARRAAAPGTAAAAEVAG